MLHTITSTGFGQDYYLLSGWSYIYLTAAVTESQNPRVRLFATLLLMSFLFFLKGAIGMRLYKNISIDIIEAVILVNLLTYSGVCLYI